MATKKKIVKKAAKKVAKKVTKKVAAEVVKVVPFNKANAKLFADNIFSDNFGRVSFLKLCDGELSDGKDGGRTLHCALGEAYFTFVDPNVAKFVNNFNQHIPTLAVVDALVDVAQLKNKDPNVKKQLAQALLDTMETNDDTCGIELPEIAQRSHDVAKMWRDRVVPLLK